MYNFKQFTDTNVRLEDRITITKSYSIGFPTKFYNDNEIANYQYVILYHDADNKLIGIRFSNNKEEQGKIAIMKSKQNYGGHIVARSFFKGNNLDPIKLKGRYTWKKKPAGELGIEENGFVYIIELIQKEK